MERYTIKQLPSGFWSVWDGDIWLNAALPSREAAEKLAKAFKSSAEEPFDLPAFLLTRSKMQSDVIQLPEEGLDLEAYLEGIRKGGDAALEGPVLLAALGPKMLALAAAQADGAVPYNVTPEHTRQAATVLGPGKVLAGLARKAAPGLDVRPVFEPAEIAEAWNSSFAG